MNVAVQYLNVLEKYNAKISVFILARTSIVSIVALHSTRQACQMCIVQVISVFSSKRTS